MRLRRTDTHEPGDLVPHLFSSEVPHALLLMPNPPPERDITFWGSRNLHRAYNLELGSLERPTRARNWSPVRELAPENRVGDRIARKPQF